MTTPEQVNAKACIYFILGFLSRPNRDWDQVPHARFFPFCVPDSESNARVIEIVSKQMSLHFDTIKTLKKMILDTLKAEYPCGTN